MGLVSKETELVLYWWQFVRMTLALTKESCKCLFRLKTAAGTLYVRTHNTESSPSREHNSFNLCCILGTPASCDSSFCFSS